MTPQKAARIETGLTLREHCLKYNLDPIEYSRLERGAISPLNDEEVLSKLPLIFKCSEDKLDDLVEMVKNT